MQIRAILNGLGIFLMLFSMSMVPPIAINQIFKEYSSNEFVLAFSITLLSGFLLWFIFRGTKHDFKTRDGFLLVTLFWFVISLFGAIPFLADKSLHLSFINAFFESVSGFTTTGATVLTNLDSLPRSIIFYRQELQFLGGMGIIILAVAVLPMLGIGGMQLYRAEMPGPIKDAKLTPRITETAKALWYLYVGLTICCAFAYWIGGLNWFDAIGESFTTVATGGFSMHDTSFTYYHSALIDSIAIVFMILSATNYALHFSAFRQRRLESYWEDTEFRTFIMIVFVVIFLCCIVLFANNVYKKPGVTVLNSIFDTVSLVTTTGFVSGQFSTWPSFIPILLMLVALIGGCAGSTSGGIKVLRGLLLFKQGMREIKRLIHPQAIVAIKFDKQVLPEHVTDAIWGFIAIFLVVFVLLLLGLMATGIGLEDAFGALVPCISNAGAGIGKVAAHFDTLNSESKSILIFAMIAGRLEIFTILILFMPSFWRS